MKEREQNILGVGGREGEEGCLLSYFHDDPATFVCTTGVHKENITSSFLFLITESLECPV